MTIYREMQIAPTYLSGYCWGPVDDEHCLGSGCKTIEEAKKEIDEYHLERTEVMITLTVDQLQAIQLMLSITERNMSTGYINKTLKPIADKISQALTDIQKDINFERTYTTND